MRKIKGINAYKQLSERRAACKILIENEIVLLKEQGYNPFTGSIIDNENIVSEIHPSTEFSEALKLACEKLDCAKNTKEDIESMLNFVNPALVQLGYSSLQICTIKRRHIKLLLEQYGKMKETWTAATYNKYRYYLRRLFKEPKFNYQVRHVPQSINGGEQKKGGKENKTHIS